MSITSLVSSSEKNSRRVRFSLPEAKLTLNDKRPLHGTSKYVNGTLINVTSTVHSTTSELGKANAKNEINGVFKSSLKTNGNIIPSKEASQYKVSPNIRPTSTKEPQGRNSLPSATVGFAPRRKMSKTIVRSGNTLPVIQKKSTSLEDFNEDSLEGEYDEEPACESKSMTMTNLNRYKSNEDLRDPINFKVKNTVVKLPEANGKIQKKAPTQNTLKVPEYSDTMTPSLQSNETNRRIKNGENVNCDKKNTKLDNNQNGNLEQFFEFVDKWRTNRLAGNRKIDAIFRNSSFQSRCSFKNSDSKSTSLLSARLKAFKMSLDQVEVVTKLLRASRNCNELLLKDCFKDILENGITSKELNSTDKSGRTALSYICSTSLTNFLELFLHLPGIDVNKADNEGNTPLHFAAQAGQTDVVNMLLTKSKGINIDAKNNLGFTPLMKAALQGRTKSAKLLLFAGASATQTDPARAFRADQWARFCGRHQTAEMIETTARSKLLEKSTSNKWPHDALPRSKTSSAMTQSGSNIIQQQTSHSGGFRSKFRKVFPFGFSLKDRQKDGKSRGGNNGFVNVSENKNDESLIGGDIVNYLTAAALSVGSSPVINGSNKQIIKSLCRPLSVPKLEVTYANNNNLIKKIENMPNMEPDEKSKSVKKVTNGIAKKSMDKPKGSNDKAKVNTDSFF